MTMVLRVFTENDRLMSLSVRFVALVFFSNGPENADLPTDRNRSGFLRPPPPPLRKLILFQCQQQTWAVKTRKSASASAFRFTNTADIRPLLIGKMLQVSCFRDGFSNEWIF